MQFTEPKAILIAHTAIDDAGLAQHLEELGAPDWDTNAPSDGEKLIEAAGKLCYRSYNLDHNPNLTRVRQADNLSYIQNGIVAVHHGSVLEHVHATFSFLNVSRVFTHEDVRHRPSNFSQESLRFVRLTDLKAYFPHAFRQEAIDKLNAEREEAGLTPLEITEDDIRKIFKDDFERAERTQALLAKLFDIDAGDFPTKKRITSAMRRLAPDGLATNIVHTSNLRNWRFMIQVRTDKAAEEEIRQVFYQVFIQLREKYPNVMADATEGETIDGIPSIIFKHHKV